MTTRRVGALFIIFGFIALVGGFFNHWMLVTVGSSGSLLRELVDQLYANIAVDSIGIGVVVLVIDSLNEKQRREETLEQLIREMKSLDNGIALRAVGELRALGHLADGVLSGRDFFMANLERAPFKFVVINDTAFGHANMRAANLMHADLRQCRFFHTNLTKASLVNAKLQKTNFSDAILLNTNFTKADIKGSILNRANLTEAKITDIQMSGVYSMRGALMPSGVKYIGRFNLEGDLLEYEIERSNQAVGSLHEFYGISQKVYERGQFWSQSINTQILWSSEGELIVHAQNFPDGQDLYEQN